MIVQPASLAGAYVIVPDEESYAANVLWVNGTILMPRGFPVTQKKLEGLRLPLRVLQQKSDSPHESNGPGLSTDSSDAAGPSSRGRRRKQGGPPASQKDRSAPNARGFRQDFARGRCLPRWAGGGRTAHQRSSERRLCLVV